MVWVSPTKSKVETFGDSWQNRNEAAAVVDIIDALVNRNVPARDIMIVTIHRGQKRLLKTLLQNHPDVRIGTIDGMQGSQAKIVIASLVKLTAFMTPQRATVLLTRATERLIIVTKADMNWEVGHPIQRLLLLLQEQNCLFSGTDRPYPAVRFWLPETQKFPVSPFSPKICRANLKSLLSDGIEVYVSMVKNLTPATAAPLLLRSGVAIGEDEGEEGEELGDEERANIMVARAESELTKNMQNFLFERDAALGTLYKWRNCACEGSAVCGYVHINREGAPRLFKSIFVKHLNKMFDDRWMLRATIKADMMCAVLPYLDEDALCFPAWK